MLILSHSFEVILVFFLYTPYSKRKVFNSLRKRKIRFLFFKPISSNRIVRQQAVLKVYGNKRETNKKIKSIKEILNKNVEYKSGQCNFNKHFIQGLKKKKKL